MKIFAFQRLSLRGVLLGGHFRWPCRSVSFKIDWSFWRRSTLLVSECIKAGPRNTWERYGWSRVQFRGTRRRSFLKHGAPALWLAGAKLCSAGLQIVEGEVLWAHVESSGMCNALSLWLETCLREISLRIEWLRILGGLC